MHFLIPVNYLLLGETDYFGNLLLENNGNLSFSICRYFVYFFDIVIFANSVFIALERNDMEVLFLALFNFEIALKLYTLGGKEFFSRYWNM